MSDKVAELTQGYEELQKESSAIEETLKEKREAHAKIAREQRELQAQIEERGQKMFSLKNEIHQKTIELQNKQREEGQVRMALETQIYENKVAALVAKQPDFYDELERIYSERVVVSDSSLEGFSSLMEPSIFREKMLKVANGGGFQGLSYLVRSAKGGYEERIRNLCEKNIKKQKVSFAEREQRFAPIVNLILSPDCEVVWNGG